MVLVLVTRPREQSAETVETLRQLGHEVLVDPMLAIAPCDPGPIDLRGIDAVAVTSANAVHALAGIGVELPVYAVGTATASAISSKFGHDVRIGPGDGDGLADLILADRRRDGAPNGILHLRGATVASDLQAKLISAGLTYRASIVYEAVAATVLEPDTIRSLRDGTLGAVALFSPRTGRTFADLVGAAGLQRSVETVDALCLSENVADAVRHLPWRRLCVAPTRDQTALIRCLAPALAAMVPPAMDGGA